LPSTTLLDCCIPAVLPTCEHGSFAHFEHSAPLQQQAIQEQQIEAVYWSGLDVACFLCREDLDYFATTKVDGHSDPEVKNRLQHVAQSGFKRITYTEAIDILLKAIQDFKPQKKGDKLFEFEVSSGKHKHKVALITRPIPTSEMPAQTCIQWGSSAELPASASNRQCFAFCFTTTALPHQPASPCSGMGCILTLHWHHILPFSSRTIYSFPL